MAYRAENEEAAIIIQSDIQCNILMKYWREEERSEGGEMRRRKQW